MNQPPPMSAQSARTRGGLLLLMAAGLTMGAVALTEWGLGRHVTIEVLVYGGVFLVVFGAAFVAQQILAPYADPVIVPCVALLNGLGLVLIHRLDIAAQIDAEFDGLPKPGGDTPNQIMWTLIGIALLVVMLAWIRDHRRLMQYTYVSGLLALILLIIPAILPARFSEVNGGKNWILLFGFSIQPGEFAKILLVIFFAGYLVDKKDLFGQAGKHVLGMDLPRMRDLAPMLGVFLFAILILVFESNLGVSLLIFGTVLSMIYVATSRPSWLLIGLACFMLGATIAYQLFSHVRVRVDTWMDPFHDFYNKGFQISQSLFGLAAGGIGGTGLGAGSPNDVPFAKTDFITATIGEELGLIGLTAVLVVYLILVIRGMRTALAVRDNFGKLLAAGLAFSLGWQVFIVVGGVTKLIPLTGLTLPFMSYGGSSVVANYAIIAILLRVSDSSRRPATPPA